MIKRSCVAIDSVTLPLSYANRECRAALSTVAPFTSVAHESKVLEECTTITESRDKDVELSKFQMETGTVSEADLSRR